MFPSDSAEVFKVFLNWLVTKRDRALSLESIFRAAGTVMAMTTRENLTKDAGVKAVYNNLRKKHGRERVPRTAITRRMIGALLGDVLGEKDTSTGKRERLMFSGEIMFGVRVGEMLGGGDGHGFLANNVVILRKLNAAGEPVGEETLEGMLEHSKTGFKRFVNAVGVSKGPAKVHFARILREYWEDAGFTIVVRREAGYQVEGPSYYVVRVSLVALASKPADDEARLSALVSTLRSSRVDGARKWADYVAYRGRQRMQGDSLDKKYINVFGLDAPTSPEADKLILELAKAGFAEEGRVCVVPGPLMRATHGRQLGLTHMPLSVSATYAPLHEYFDAAYALANAESPDPELDLEGQAAPNFGHHSDRRGADTVARQTREQTGATVEDIDIVFGWKEAFYSKDMQRHYETSFDRERRCLVTSMMLSSVAPGGAG